MGIYSRELQKYNLLKDFRVKNGTVWNYSKNLVFWLRADNSTKELVDRSNNQIGISTGIGSTGFTDAISGPRSRFDLDAINFDNKYYSVAGGEAADPSGNKSIVFAGWIYLNVSPGLNNQGFNIIQTDATEGWSIFVDDQGRLGIRLSNYADTTHDGGSSTLKFSERKTSNSVISEGRWTHFLVFIDKNIFTETQFSTASDTDESPSQRVHIMIDGQVKTLTDSSGGSSHTGLDPKTAAASYRVGYGPAKDETQAKVFLDGAICDLVMLQPDGDLTFAELRAMYQASYNGAYPLGSGFISTSPFNVLNDAMHRETHPTIARHSNDGRPGNHQIFFDDAKAIHLASNGSSSFPSMITEDNPLFGTIYNGIENGDLKSIAASASFGIFDEYYEENNSITISPFIESKIYLNSGSNFYTTGTADLPGFNQPLKNKMVMTFNLEHRTEQVLGLLSNGMIGDEIPLLAYYNFTDKKFENNGVFTRKNSVGPKAVHYFTGSHAGFSFIDNLHSWDGTAESAGTADVANNSSITWSTADLTSFNLSFNANQAKVAGGPTDIAGFPSDERYVPTQDQIFTTSNFTDKPFLLEKITVKFKINVTQFQDYFKMISVVPFRANDGSYRSLHRNTLYYLLPTFFIGRTYPDNFSITRDLGVKAISSSGTGTGPFDITLSAQHNTNELITYMQGFKYFEDTDLDIYTSLPTINADDFSFDYKELLSPASADPSNLTTGEIEFCIESTPKLINKNPALASMLTSNDSRQVAIPVGYSSGPTKLYNELSERSLSKSILGTKIKVTDHTRFGTSGGTYGSGAGATSANLSDYLTEQVLITESKFAEDPKANSATYVLMPNDKLFFGFGAPLHRRIFGNSAQDARGGYTLPIQDVEVQFFGSEIQDENVARSSHSQPLGTQTVHESIGDITVRDVFSISLPGELSGSFADDVMSGSIDPTTTYEGHDHVTGEIIKLARRVGGRASQGTQGETGAFKINNRLVDTSERDYDSIMPDFAFITSIDDARFDQLATEKLATLGLLKFGNIAAGANAHWFYSYPFEGRYADVARTHTISKPDGSIQASYKMEFADTAAGTNFISFSNTGTILTGSTGFSPRNTVESLAVNNQGTLNQLQPADDIIRILFAAGDLSRGRFFAIGADSDGDRVGVNSANAGATINFGGFKYGISNSAPAYSSAVFRRTSFGQFRDLLEPRQFRAYFQDEKINHAVTQNFFTRQGQPLNRASRANTTCSNLSSHATSSLPFFDRENNSPPLNRDANSSVSAVNISPNFAPGQGPFTGLL